MSDKQIQRRAVLQDVKDHRITQVHAAEIPNISTLQITRLLLKLSQGGISGLAHASHGQPDHHRHDSAPCVDTINRVVNALGLKLTVQNA